MHLSPHHSSSSLRRAIAIAPADTPRRHPTATPFVWPPGTRSCSSLSRKLVEDLYWHSSHRSPRSITRPTNRRQPEVGIDVTRPPRAPCSIHSFHRPLSRRRTSRHDISVAGPVDSGHGSTRRLLPAGHRPDRLLHGLPADPRAGKRLPERDGRVQAAAMR